MKNFSIRPFLFLPLEHIRIIGFTYFLLGFVPLILSFLVYHYLADGLGESESARLLLDGFNRTVFTDLINHNGEAFNDLKNQFRIGFLMQLGVLLFAASALTSSIIEKNQTLKVFFSLGLKNFWRIHSISLIAVLVWLVWTAGVFIPYFYLLGDPIQDYSSERPFIYSLLGTAFIYLLGCIFIWLYFTSVKIFRVKGAIFKDSFIRSKALLQTKRSLFYMTLFVVAVHFFLFSMVLMINAGNSAKSWFFTLLAVLGFQSIAFIRIWMQASVIGFIDRLD